jgi:hypothetical protein
MSTRMYLYLAVAWTVVVGIGVCTNVSMADIVVTFQQGALVPTEAGGNGAATYSGTKDLHLREHAPTFNTGGEPNVLIGRYGNGTDDDSRMLFDFNSYGTLGNYMQTNNLTIKSAKLKLYLNGTVGSATYTGQTVDVFMAATSFYEGAGADGEDGRDGRAASGMESSWRYCQGAGNWAGGGAHSSSDWSTTLDTGIVLGTTGQWYNFNVTGAFAANGSDLNDAHNGFVLLERADAGNPYADSGNYGKQFLFNSRQAGSNRPVLEFTLAPVPEPSSLVLAALGLLGLLAYAWRKQK